MVKLTRTSKFSTFLAVTCGSFFFFFEIALHSQIGCAAQVGGNMVQMSCGAEANARKREVLTF